MSPEAQTAQGMYINTNWPKLVPEYKAGIKGLLSVYRINWGGEERDLFYQANILYFFLVLLNHTTQKTNIKCRAWVKCTKIHSRGCRIDSCSRCCAEFTLHRTLGNKVLKHRVFPLPEWVFNTKKACRVQCLYSCPSPGMDTTNHFPQKISPFWLGAKHVSNKGHPWALNNSYNPSCVRVISELEHYMRRFCCSSKRFL